MGKILATYDLTVTLRAPDDMPDEVADALPTVGPASTEEVSGPFIPGVEIATDMVQQLVSQATQLQASVTGERTDK